MLEGKRILIIQTAFIGDVVLATPLIENLYATYPGARIDFLLRKGNENLLQGHPKIANLLIWDKKKDKFKNLIKLIRKFRSEPYDLLINLQRFGSTGLMTWLSGAKEKIGFSKNPFSFSYTRKVEHEIANGMHEVARNLKLIAHLVKNVADKPKLYPPAEAIEKVKPYQQARYIVLAPTSVWYTKQLPEEKWIEFLGALDFEGKIYLIGAPSDYEKCNRILKESGKGENLCGRLSLIESVALIKGAVMNYVNDSAPMHFASSVDAPTCAIFCSTIPDFGFGPLATTSHVVEVAEKLACRPCGLHGKKECPEGHFDCGKLIDTQQLIDCVKH
ncbi:MAG: glycosyltransferase family 9 protein [Bacteroidota bacterium]